MQAMQCAIVFCLLITLTEAALATAAAALGKVSNKLMLVGSSLSRCSDPHVWVITAT